MGRLPAVLASAVHLLGGCIAKTSASLRRKAPCGDRSSRNDPYRYSEGLQLNANTSNMASNPTCDWRHQTVSQPLRVSTLIEQVHMRYRESFLLLVTVVVTCGTSSENATAEPFWLSQAGSCLKTSSPCPQNEQLQYPWHVSRCNKRRRQRRSRHFALAKTWGHDLQSEAHYA